MNMNNKRVRIPLILVNLFVAATTLYGAVAVVPELPLDWLRFFPDYTIPALALGLVGCAALVAAVGVAVAPKLGAEVSLLAGLMMMAFEFVEALTVGSLLNPPPVTNAQGNVALWLQVFYFVVGLGMVLLGQLLWADEAPRERWSSRLRHALTIES